MLASALAWTFGAAASVGVGMLALSLIGGGSTVRADQPLTPDEVAREVSVASHQPAPSASVAASTPPPASGSPQPTAPPGHSDRIVSSAGGSVVARCDPAGAYLVSWSPAPGYLVEGASRGPAGEVSVTFESATARVVVFVTCVNGSPQSRISQGAEDHGGGGGTGKGHSGRG
jgi:hypothetical protein